MPKYFAEVNKGIVLRVIVANQDFIDSGVVGDPGNWVETFIDGESKKNYAGVGYTYDTDRDAFIAPTPFKSFVLNEKTARYEAPIEYPKDGKKYNWDDDKVDWVKIK